MTWSFPSLQPDAPWSLPRLRWSGESQRGAACEPAAAENDLGPALEHFARSDWCAAYHELRRLADRGVPEASRIASMMQARGTRLFGGSFVDFTTVERAQRRERRGAIHRSASGRIAFAALVFVVAGLTGAATILVARGNGPSTVAASPLVVAPPVPEFVKTVPEASDVLPAGEAAPEPDTVPYGG